jgi:hypothetical protein
MNRRYIISFELAKLLKEFGCNCVTNFYYRSDGNPEIGIEVNNDILMEGNIASPAYCELIGWFEEKYGIIILCNIWLDYNTKKLYYWASVTTPDGEFSAEDCPTREEAYEAGVLMVIDYIKENQN